jgi:protein-S-isoprenylcysteine O-methyltransferase Ste14
VTTGVYGKIRHPMYSAIFLYVAAQAFLLPNWIAGPAGLIAFSIMYVLRLKLEEKMMLDSFGDEYLQYMKRTKRLIPGVY